MKCHVKFDLVAFRKHFTPTLILKLILFCMDTHSVQQALWQAERKGNKDARNAAEQGKGRHEFVTQRGRVTSIGCEELLDAFDKVTIFYLQKHDSGPTLLQVVHARLRYCDSMLLRMKRESMCYRSVYKSLLRLCVRLAVFAQYTRWYNNAARCILCKEQPLKSQIKKPSQANEKCRSVVEEAKKVRSIAATVHPGMNKELLVRILNQKINPSDIWSVTVRTNPGALKKYMELND